MNVLSLSKELLQKHCITFLPNESKSICSIIVNLCLSLFFILILITTIVRLTALVWVYVCIYIQCNLFLIRPEVLYQRISSNQLQSKVNKCNKVFDAQWYSLPGKRIIS